MARHLRRGSLTLLGAILLVLAGAAYGLTSATRPAPPAIAGPHETESASPVFRFRSRGAARFVCAFDSTRLRRCAAQYSKRLTLGRHLLRVQAVGATGLRSRITAHAVVVVAPALRFSFTGQIAAESDGKLLVAESGGRINRVDPSTGTVSMVTPATRPFGLAIAPSGAAYFSDQNALLRIDPGGGVSTVATFASDVGPLVVAPNGDVYATTVGRIYRLAGGSLPAEPYVGTGDPGDSGDGGPALAARIGGPHGLTLAPDGALLIADTGNGRLRRVDPSTHTITAVATVDTPYGVAVGPDGLIYLASNEGNRIVRLDATGAVSLFVSGLRVPSSLTFDRAGWLYVTEGSTRSGRVWRIDRDGNTATLRRGGPS